MLSYLKTATTNLTIAQLIKITNRRRRPQAAAGCIATHNDIANGL